MPKIAITGQPGVGKSTLARRVIERLGCKAGRTCGTCKIGGVLARDIRVEGKRVGFEILDIATGARGTLASVDGTGPRLGRYHVNLQDLDEIGARAIEDAVANADLVVIDEVGPMELFSERFETAVEMALDSEKSMLVVVQAKSKHPLARRIRDELRLIIVTRENRGDLAERIARLVRARSAIDREKGYERSISSQNLLRHGDDPSPVKRDVHEDQNA